VRSLEVSIVKAEPTDVRFLYDLYVEPETMKMVGLAKQVHPLEWDRMVKGLWDGWRDVWVVREGPVTVGHIALQNRCDPNSRAEVAVAIHPTRRGRGVARTALGRLLEVCDQEFKLDLLIARMREDNEGALVLFEKAGFEQAGRIRRYFRYAKGFVAQITMVRFRPGTVPTSKPLSATATERVVQFRVSEPRKTEVKP
jgi:RimJ/RimL family protein N-acetyltransferase